MLLDTHCHLDYVDLSGQRGGLEAALERSRAAGVKGVVLPAVSPENFDRVRDLAHGHEDVFYALGIHPIYVERLSDTDLEALENALHRNRHDPRLIAVGEIGLDHYLPGLNREKMEYFFQSQLQMAASLDLPVILHVRKAQDRVLKHLRQSGVRKGIAHAFNGSLQQAEAFIQLGFALGFGGAMTFSRALQIRRLAVSLPLESIVLETDSPDLSPAWKGRHEENEPSEVARIADCLARLRGLSGSEIIEVTGNNALRVLPRLRPSLAV